MAQVGNLGDLIIFSVSYERLLTFNKLNRTVKGRWASHEIIGKKPRAEFIGPGSQSLSFPIYLTVMHGVKPRKVIEEIEEAIENGEPFDFVVGGKKIGKNKWVIESASETWDALIDDGKLVACNLNLTLSEYV